MLSPLISWAVGGLHADVRLAIAQMAGDFLSVSTVARGAKVVSELGRRGRKYTAMRAWCCEIRLAPWVDGRGSSVEGRL